MADPIAVVMMGVTGSGKSVVGTALATRLGARFIEGDRLHPLENIARMSAGIALTDADRAGWLDRIAAAIVTETAAGHAVVATCSALKRRYRDQLRAAVPNLLFVYLDIDRATAHRRVEVRKHHFMPASLVDSQFADLEPPATDEDALQLDATRDVGELAVLAAGWIGER